MGTRSLTVVRDEFDVEIITMYRQMDGYPTGHGADLLDWGRGGKVVNGIGTDTPKKAYNGMRCLAAQLVAAFKDGIGDIYLHPSGTRDVGEEYLYEISPDKQGRLRLKVTNLSGVYEEKTDRLIPGATVLYSGLLDKFDPEAAEKRET